jgi:hypothetical protein
LREFSGGSNNWWPLIGRGKRARICFFSRESRVHVSVLPGRATTAAVASSGSRAGSPFVPSPPITNHIHCQWHKTLQCYFNISLPRRESIVKITVIQALVLDGWPSCIKFPASTHPHCRHSAHDNLEHVSSFLFSPCLTGVLSTFTHTPHLQAVRLDPGPRHR